MEILQNFVTPLGRFKVENQDPWKFMIFSWTHLAKSWNFHMLFLFFSGIAQYMFLLLETLLHVLWCNSNMRTWVKEAVWCETTGNQGKSKPAAKYETKLSCSFYNLCLDFLFTHVFFWFCDSLRVFFPWKKSGSFKHKTCLVSYLAS